MKYEQLREIVYHARVRISKVDDVFYLTIPGIFKVRVYKGWFHRQIPNPDGNTLIFKSPMWYVLNKDIRVRGK